MKQDQVSKLDELLLVKIPTTLHEAWLEITAQQLSEKIPREQVQANVYSMLRTYIISRYPVYKLCAFEELGKEQAKALHIESGMYLKLRLLTADELKLAVICDKEGKLGKEGNPRWILETAQIDELRIESYQKQLSL
jgi:hypothetical protein